MFEEQSYRQWFSENVSNLRVSAYMLDLHCPALYVRPEVMIFDVDMFHPLSFKDNLKIYLLYHTLIVMVLSNAQYRTLYI